jgi:amidase
VLREALAIYQPDTDAAFERAIAALRPPARSGRCRDPDRRQWDKDEYEVLLYEFKDGLDATSPAAARRCKTLAELIAFNTRMPTTEMPFFGQELFEQAQRRAADRPAYIAARDKARRLAGPKASTPR